MSLKVTKIEVKNKKRTQRLTSHLGGSLIGRTSHGTDHRTEDIGSNPIRSIQNNL